MADPQDTPKRKDTAPVPMQAHRPNISALSTCVELAVKDHVSDAYTQGLKSDPKTGTLTMYAVSGDTTAWGDHYESAEIKPGKPGEPTSLTVKAGKQGAVFETLPVTVTVPDVNDLTQLSVTNPNGHWINTPSSGTLQTLTNRAVGTVKDVKACMATTFKAPKM